MKQTTSKWVGGLVVTTILTSVVTACAPDNKPPSNDASPKTQHVSYKQTAPQTSVPSRQKRTQSDTQHLVQLALKIPQVKQASAVSLGRYTIVAIDVDPDLDSSRVGTVKYAVAQALRDDPRGKSALVTADVDLMGRINAMNKEINQGRPIAGIMRELAAIASRIAPQPSMETKKRERNETNQDRRNTNQSPTGERSR